MKGNCKVDILTLTGTGSKEYTMLTANVEVFIVPASTNTKAMYGEMPSGSMYSYKIEGVELDIRPESKFVVKDNRGYGLAVGDTFITNQYAQKTYIAGRSVIIGECNKI